MYCDLETQSLIGEHGALNLTEGDEVTLKLVMLLEGECEGLGPIKAARKYGFSKARYFQLKQAYLEHGAMGLHSKLIRQVIRYRFLDPQASAEVITQKLRQTGFVISVRSVERVIADYGLQKKTLSVSSSE